MRADPPQQRHPYPESKAMPVTRKHLLLAACALAALILTRPRHADAEHFDILLRVQTPHTQAEAFMDTTPPIGGVNRRPIVNVKVGEEIRVVWRMKNIYPHGAFK